MAKLFTKGDVVMLKSGGPRMTIEHYKWVVGFDYSKESDTKVLCSWFDKDGKLERKEFEQEALKKAEIELE